MTTRAGGEIIGTRDTFQSATETQPRRCDIGGVISSAPANPSNAPPIPPASMTFG